MRSRRAAAGGEIILATLKDDVLHVNPVNRTLTQTYIAAGP